MRRGQIAAGVETMERQNDLWKAREQDRFLRCEYRMVPWEDELFYVNSPHHGEHFTHVANADPRMIAYTESADKGRRDIQTRVKPGRYLKRWFGDVLTDDEIKGWAEKFAGENATQELRFAREPDEIERVYVNGPRSCMSYDAASYESECHPARVYGAGDLAIAYIEPEAGSVTARVVCWPERKLWSRIYGDESRLAGLLEKAGFCRAGCGDFDGARLLKIEHDCDQYVCPYLDMADEVGIRGDYLVIGDCGHDARNTNGLTGSPGIPCDNCGDHCDEEDTYRVGDDNWCSCCYRNHAFSCDECEESYPNDYSRTVHSRRGREITICDGCYDCGDYGSCDDCGDDHHSDNLTSVTGRHGDEITVCETCRDESYSTCDECDECHHEVNMDNIDDRRLCESCAGDARADAESDETGDADGTGDMPCGTVDDPRQLPLTLEHAA
jgi:hypothetical protein